MRVLVTGAAGFIGHHFIEHVLATTDWDVVGTVSFRHRGCPLRLRHLMDDPRLELVRTELAAPVSPRVASSIGNVDVMVNFASESHVDRSIEEPRPFVLNNVELMISMLELAQRVQPRVFLQVSTDEVYGPATGEAFAEWSAILPSNPYAASKAAQEALAISWWRTYGTPLVLVNSMNLIGERQDCEKYLPKLIRTIHRGERMTVHGDPILASFGSRMYLHARNLSDAICWLVRRQPARYPTAERPDRWHIVGEREVDNLELAQMVARIMERPIDVEVVDFHRARPGHDRRYALNGSLIHEAGWRQPVDLEQSIERTVRWTVENPRWMV